MDKSEPILLCLVLAEVPFPVLDCDSVVLKELLVQYVSSHIGLKVRPSTIPAPMDYMFSPDSEVGSVID